MTICSTVIGGIPVSTVELRASSASPRPRTTAAAAAACGFATPEELVAATPDEIFSRFAMMDEAGKPLAPADLPHVKVLAGEFLLRREERGREAGGVEQPPERVALAREVMPERARALAGVDPHEEHPHAGPDAIRQPAQLRAHSNRLRSFMPSCSAAPRKVCSPRALYGSPSTTVKGPPKVKFR